ncbi:MAG: FKBP-type peptidyl-prolyl cis-trans isomerase [Oleiphilaceae bacterium]|nr:FKBP-type peptidyl-prolyl cis-trans isomerase [Oleiphilaceae bacterium]
MTKALIVIIVIAIAIFVVHRMQLNKKHAAVNQQEGIAYLEQNKTKEGVRTTDSGLQIETLREGDKQTYPKANSRVEVHYHGTLTDGTVFDSSVARGQPIEFGLHQVIPGWTEGLQLMSKGEKARLTIPSHLAYGARAAGAIPPHSTLIFEVELLNIR